MTEAQIKVGEPQPQIKQMSWFIGEWDIQSKMRKHEVGWVEDVCYSSVQPMLGGHALQERFWGMLGGEPIDAMSMRTFNETLDRWEQAWLDTSGHRIAVFYGEWDGEKFIGQSRDTVENPDAERKVREVFFDIEEDRFSWKLEMINKENPEWTPIWTLEYTRKD
ncbi:MAG: DUF1579 domain-containing protein [Chloroflexi bacterium]|nr:DUF1579 domain-containing protein [Chloroflexota bacterium]